MLKLQSSLKEEKTLELAIRKCHCEEVIRHRRTDEAISIALGIATPRSRHLSRRARNDNVKSFIYHLLAAGVYFLGFWYLVIGIYLVI